MVATPRWAAKPRVTRRLWRAPLPAQQVPPVLYFSHASKKSCALSPGRPPWFCVCTWINLRILSNGTCRHHAAYTVLSPWRWGLGGAERPNLLSTRSSRSGASSSVLVDIGIPPTCSRKDAVLLGDLSAQMAVRALGKAAAYPQDTNGAKHLALAFPVEVLLHTIELLLKLELVQLLLRLVQLLLAWLCYENANDFTVTKLVELP